MRTPTASFDAKPSWRLRHAPPCQLVLIRSALPKVDEKAASKWAAALELAEQDAIAPKHFIAFLREIGGIEGAHRQRARLRRKHARR